MKITLVGSYGIAAANRQHNQPIVLSNNEMLQHILDHLHLNRVVTGFLDQPEYWRYSSAIYYSGGEGLFNVCIIE